MTSSRVTVAHAPERIKTEEKIALGAASDSDGGGVVAVTPRRRSLVDMSPATTTPKLPVPVEAQARAARRRTSGERVTPEPQSEFIANHSNADTLKSFQMTQASSDFGVETHVKAGKWNHLKSCIVKNFQKIQMLRHLNASKFWHRANHPNFDTPLPKPSKC